MALYLVTGGAGFIGSALVRALLDQGKQVRVADNFSTGKRENLAGVLDRIELLEGDLADEAVARKAVAGTEFVLHQAAIPSVPRSIEDPMASNRANVTATLNMLVAARDAGVKRLVYASSSSAYGDSEVLPKVETQPDNPISPYALTKLAGEKYAVIFHRIYGVSTASLRYFNVFGPRQDPNSPYSAVISKFVTAALQGHRPTVHGDGEQSRDFTFVENVVSANLLACHAEGVSGMVFNVGTGERHTLNDLLRTLSTLLGRDLDPEYVAPRRGDVRHSLADIGRARQHLGYEVKVGFEEGLRRTVTWFRESLGDGFSG
jgi:nucleoside-diphosphate-sugar epimerase